MADLVVLVVPDVVPQAHRDRSTCSKCGSRFKFYAKTESGKILFYWCEVCDVPGFKT